jgi:hypothetical protein
MDELMNQGIEIISVCEMQIISTFALYDADNN